MSCNTGWGALIYNVRPYKRVNMPSSAREDSLGYRECSRYYVYLSLFILISTSVCINLTFNRFSCTLFSRYALRLHRMRIQGGACKRRHSDDSEGWFQNIFHSSKSVRIKCTVNATFIFLYSSRFQNSFMIRIVGNAKLCGWYLEDYK